MTIEFIARPDLATPSQALQVVLPRQAAPYPHSHLAACQKAAQKAGAALCTAPFQNDGRISMAYIGPKGTVLQDACFLPDELQAHTPGAKITVTETPFGRLAMACGLDALQPQFARLAALQGCQLMVCGLWLRGKAYLMAGPWSGAQANCMAVAAAQPDGGQLLLPCALTKDQSGLGRTEFKVQELAEAYKSFPVFDCMNTDLYARYEEVFLQ